MALDGETDKKVEDLRTEARNLSLAVKEQLRYSKNLRTHETVQKLIAPDPTHVRLNRAKKMVISLKADIRYLNETARRLRIKPIRQIKKDPQNDEEEGAPPSTSPAQRKRPPPRGDADGEVTLESQMNRWLEHPEDLEKYLKGVGDLEKHVMPMLNQKALQTRAQKAAAEENEGNSADSPLMLAVLDLTELKQQMSLRITRHLAFEKAKLDRLFGSEFTHIEVQLDRKAANDIELADCMPDVISSIDLFMKFDVMSHTVFTLQSVKEGLHYAVDTAVLQKEKEELDQMLTKAKSEQQNIRQTYEELMNPELRKSLQSRQKMKIEEMESELKRLRGQVEELQHHNARYLAENARLSDSYALISSTFDQYRESREAEISWLKPRVQIAEQSTQKLGELAKQLTLDVDLVTGMLKKYQTSEEERSLKNKGLVKNANQAEDECKRQRIQISKLQSEGSRKDRLMTVALAARETVMKQYGGMKEEIKAHVKEIDVLNDRIARLENKIEQQLQDLTDSKSMIAQKEDQKKDVITQLRQTKARLAMKESDFKKLQKRFDQEKLTGLSEEKQREWEVMEGKIDKAKETILDHQNKIQELIKVLFDLEARGIRIPNIQKYNKI